MSEANSKVVAGVEQQACTTGEKGYSFLRWVALLRKIHKSWHLQKVTPCDIQYAILNDMSMACLQPKQRNLETTTCTGWSTPAPMEYLVWRWHWYKNNSATQVLQRVASHTEDGRDLVLLMIPLPRNLSVNALVSMSKVGLIMD